MNELAGLQELGFSPREALVYLALLREGQAGAGVLLKRTGLYRVMLYETLEKLVARGLVSFFELNRRRQFVAEPPQKLLDELRLKEALASDVIARLGSLRPADTAPVFRLYEGLLGVKSAQENYLQEMDANPAGEYLMAGANFALHQKLDGFFNSFHEKRSALRIPARLLFNPDNKAFGELKKKYRLTKVRYLPGNFLTPSWISMYGDVVLMGVIDEHPLAIFIKNRRIAESYRNYFELMWKVSRQK